MSRGYADDAFGRDRGGARSLLSKPFSLETLAQRVQDELDSVDRTGSLCAS